MAGDAGSDDPGGRPETEIDIPGSYHRYYGDDHYGDRPEGGRTVPDELWRVLLAWGGAQPPQAGRARRVGLKRAFLAVAAAGIMAALLYAISR